MKTIHPPSKLSPFAKIKDTTTVNNIDFGEEGGLQHL